MSQLVNYFNNTDGKQSIQNSIDEVWINSHSKIREMIDKYDTMVASGMDEQSIFPDKKLFFENKKNYANIDKLLLKYKNPNIAFLCEKCKLVQASTHKQQKNTTKTVLF